MNDGYREVAPPASLRPFVSCFWARPAGSADGRTETRVLPDGALDIILDLGAHRPEDSAYLVGAMTRPLLVTPPKTSDYLAVRFHPGGAHGLLRFPLHEVTDRRVPLEDLWPGTADWVDQLREQETEEARLRRFGELLARRTAEAALEPRVVEAVTRLRAARGEVSVDRLSRTLGISRQHLTRLFERHVGVGVKFFARVVRLQSVLSAFPSESHPRERSSWALFALDHGYFDQAHFVADFRALTGLTPRQFRAR